ncbi:MAG: MotA/TolQ/ExbB proton channel family protein [Nostoc sp. SerVER01]|nr:MotA/TolQ/ExbB proton channel family protein [Nostoc sp. SerVER01]
MAKRVKSDSESSPASLIWKPSFWFQQKDFFIVIVLSGFFLSLLWEYTYGQKDTITLALNSLIHSLGLLGIRSSIIFLAEIKVNTDIVEEIEDQGNEYLKKIKSSPRFRVDLEKLQQDILPNNRTVPTPAMIRLFQRIIIEAKDRKFESSISVVQPYQDESYEKILQLTQLQKLALRLGILGTFIGLIIAIKDLAEQGINEDITQLIKILFSSLYIAFSTSVAGLEVAILLGVLLSILLTKQKKYFKKMEASVITMLSIARNAINKDEFLAEFSQMYNLTKELSNKIYDYNQSVTKSVGNAERKIAVLTIEIEEGLKQLSQSKAEFDGFINNLSSTQKQFITEMQQIYDVISLKRISDELQRSIIDTGRNVGNRVGQTEEKVEIQTKQIQQGISRLTATYGEFSQFLDELHQTQERFIAELRKSYDVVSINKVEQALNNNSSQIQRLARVIDENANASLWTRLRRLF